MNISIKIKRFAEKNTTPDKNLCPRVIQKWQTKNGWMFWDSKTKKRSTTCPIPTQTGWRDRVYANDRNIFGHTLMNTSKEYFAFYAKYHEKMEVLELALISCPGNRGVDGEEKEWSYDVHDRFFLAKGNVHPFNAKGEDAFPYEHGKYYNKGFIDWLCNGIFNKSLTYDSCAEIWKYFGTKVNPTARWNSNSEMTYMYQIVEYYKSMAPRDVKKNDILLIELEPIMRSNAIVFQKIDDCTGVFRYFNQNYVEVFRIFIRKGKVTITVCQNNNWSVTGNRPSRYIRWNSTFTFDNFEQIDEIKELAWLKNILDGQEKTRDKLYAIVDCLRHPIIESLWKSGYKKLADTLLKSETPIATAKELFGIQKEPKTIKDLKLNKYLLAHSEELKPNNSWYSSIHYPFKAMKEMYGEDKVIHMNKEDSIQRCDFWKDVIDEYSRWHYGFLITDDVPYYLRTRGEYEIHDVDKKLLERVFNIWKKDKTITALYKDTVITYKSICGNRPDIDFLSVIHDRQDIAGLHDDFVRIYNEEQAVRNAIYNTRTKEEIEKRNKVFQKYQDERRERFNASDDEFVIKVPEELSEITNEGVSLGHCVGGYVGSHALNETNIIFLRRKEEENVPFYTMEVRGNNLIQIHGRKNKWLGNNPEAIPFVAKWLKERGIVFQNKMLLNLGMGYSASTQSLNAADYGLA